jgi:cytidylate kinase
VTATLLLRSMAYHVVNQTPRIAAIFKDILPEHPRFDKSFVFTASIEARQGRLQQRMQEDPEEVAPDDLMMLDKPEKFMAMEKVLVDLATTAFGATVIDTSKLKAEEVCNIVIEGVYGDKAE